MTCRILIGLVLLLLATAAASADGRLLPTYERIVLDNGVVLLLSEKHDVPLIGLRAVIRGGAAADPADKNGLASLVAGMLEKGAGDRDSAAFAEAVAAVGGELSSSADLETIAVSAEFLSRDGELMLELVADMLRRPTLAENEFEKLRERAVNQIKAAKNTNPRRLLPSYGTAFLFGDHPYGNPVGGSEATLAAVTHDDLLQFYENYVGGDRLIISVVGDFNTVAMKDRLEQHFGDWPVALQPLPDVPGSARQPGRRVLLVDVPDTTQTYFWIGNLAVPVSYPRRAELDLANTLFGGRFTSMLNTALRVKSGLTYGAWSSLRRFANGGYIVISSFTDTGNTTRAIDMALDLQVQLRNAGIDEEQIESARNYIMGQFPPRLETSPQLAAELATLEQYGLDDAYVNEYSAALSAVDADGITEVVEEVYAAPRDMVFVLIGDAAAIREAIGDYGAVTEVSISEPRLRH